MNANHGMTRAWLTCLAERAPLPALMGIGALQSLASYYLVRSGFDGTVIALGAVGVAALLVLMRVMDEVKDLAKDRVAHPERPLPRGLIRVADAQRAIGVLGAAAFVFAAALAVAGHRMAGALYAGCVAYTGLMYREFFFGSMLRRNAFAYALSHQLVLLPMYAFTVALASPAQAFAPATIWFALTGLGASFAFEVARKLDPHAHPVLATYLTVSGRGAVVGAIAISLALLAISAQRLGVHFFVWPFVAVVAAMLPLVYWRPERHRVIQRAAAVLCLAQVLAPTLRHAWMVLR